MIKTLDDLRAMREQAELTAGSRKFRIMVCGGTGCTSSHSPRICENMRKKLAEYGLSEQVEVISTGCFGLCAKGPIVLVQPGNVYYSRVTPEDADEIITSHIVGGVPVERLLFLEPDQTGELRPFHESSFFTSQTRIALRNCGALNPERVEEYIARDGYRALGEILTNHVTPEQVIDTVLKSGLRGRGGAGFPTGMKWKFAAEQPKGQKYVCCNALEGDPHSVIEAMAIAAYAIGSNQGYVYVRAEYPIAVRRLQIAINQAREIGLLGKNIFGTDFDFDLDIRLGAGAFVCGEETALMTSIEGKRGEPRPRPPFPAVKGLFESPTILNNVETYANIPWIFLNGWEAFAKMGTEKSKGTKVFALGGKIVNTGLVEIPMGTPLRTVIEDIGGGIPNGKKFKAAQTGGPSGGCIPASLIDTPIDYDSLISIGSMMGSGGLIVMDEDNCMVDIAKFFVKFTMDESCGKCAPCRIGTRRMYQILEKITDGKATMDDLDTLEELCNHIKANALCGLGQTAPNPVLSTLHYFRDEYIAHIVDKKCPAGVCKGLMHFHIDPAKCRGCSACVRGCPVDAISGILRNPHTIDITKCVKCGTCLTKCKFDAISQS